MSEPRLMNRCGKVGWPTRNAAERTLKIRKRHRQSEQRVYHCPVCKRFHMTSQPFDSFDRRMPREMRE